MSAPSSGPMPPGDPKASENKDKEQKKCLTYFYPMDGWKGEYGFDWFRLPSKPEPEVIDEEGRKASIYFENIGKHYDYGIVASWDTVEGESTGEKKEIHAYSDGSKFTGLGVDVRTHDTKTKEDDLFLNSRGSVDIAYGFSTHAETQRLISYITGGTKSFAQYCLKVNGLDYPVYRLSERGRKDLYYIINYFPFRGFYKYVEFDFTPVENGKKYHYACEYDIGSRKLMELILTKRGEDDDCEIEQKFTKKNDLLSKANKKHWEPSKDLVDRLWDNKGIDSVTLPKDKRVSNVKVDCAKYSVTVYHADHSWECYYYEAAAICYIECGRPAPGAKNAYEGYGGLYYCYSGTVDEIKKKLKAENLKVNEEMLTDPTWLPARIMKKDSTVVKVETTMHKPDAVYYKLELEEESAPVDFIDLSTDEISDQVLKKVMVTSMKADSIPEWTGKGFKFTNSEAEYKGDERLELFPYWKDALDGHYHLFNYQNKVVFYPIPTLSMIDFAWRDKKRDLEKKIKLQVQTVGEFDKVYFESDDDDIVDYAIGNGSTTKKMDTVKLVPEGASEERHSIIAREKNGQLVGQLDVYVFKPIHLKICFIDVNFQEREIEVDGLGETVKKKNGLHPSVSGNSGGGKKWKYKDDKFIQIFGQAGIIFDDIEEESMTIEEVYFDKEDHTYYNRSELDLANTANRELLDSKDAAYLSNFQVWNQELGENVFNYDNMLEYYARELEEKGSPGVSPAKYFDEKFLGFYPEYVDYIRVYVLDKYMIQEGDLEKTIHHMSYDGYEGIFDSGVLLFRKSVELCDAKESNPLSNVLLRYLGLTENFNNYKKWCYEYRTTSNVMDYSDYRYSLTATQWERMRDRAKELLVSQAEKKQRMKDGIE